MDSVEHKHTGRLEITWEDFGRMCRELALKIKNDFEPDIIVGVAKAGVIPGAVMSSLFRKDLYTIKISRRKNDRIVHARPLLFVPVTDSVHGKKVLIVDEISVTGQTLKIASDEVMSKAAKEVRTATLFIHSNSFRPHYYALESDAMIINPWDHYIIDENNQIAVHPDYLEENFPEKN